MYKVYLAGPITGLTYEEATRRRQYCRAKLLEYGIAGYSPLRTKGYLANEKKIGDSYEQYALSSQKGITERDRYDCRTSDVVFFDFADTTVASVGSCIELGWADAYRNPIVTVMDIAAEEALRKNPHDHAMVRAVSGYIVPTLDEGLEIVRAILLP